MALQIYLTDILILVIGTLTTFMTVSAVIFFAFIFQRKLYHKQEEFREIEKLLKKEELKSAYALIEGREAERKQIAEDLHDNLGSLLSTLRIYADTLLSQTNQLEKERLINKICQMTEMASQETRRISHTLDSGTLRYGGLTVAVEQLAEAISDSRKLDVETFMDVSQPIHSELNLNIYRVIQELFANTLKHAAASKVRLEITQIPSEYISIIFEDNGKGFDMRTAKKGIGLQHIYSRVERFQGQVTVDSRENIGTTFIIELPL